MTVTTQDLPAPGQDLPTIRSRDGVAPLVASATRKLHAALFAAGAVMLPAGLILIGFGWHGAANTPYAYDQMTYLISGGILGLGITFAGGFLYFGAWLAKASAEQAKAAAEQAKATAEQRETQRALLEAVTLLLERPTAEAPSTRPGPSA
jgi:hypothetical protein